MLTLQLGHMRSPMCSDMNSLPHLRHLRSFGTFGQSGSGLSFEPFAMSGNNSRSTLRLSSANMTGSDVELTNDLPVRNEVTGTFLITGSNDVV
jgi:hypothetical protein